MMEFACAAGRLSCVMVVNLNVSSPGGYDVFMSLRAVR